VYSLVQRFDIHWSSTEFQLSCYYVISY